MIDHKDDWTDLEVFVREEKARNYLIRKESERMGMWANITLGSVLAVMIVYAIVVAFVVMG